MIKVLWLMAGAALTTAPMTGTNVSARERDPIEDAVRAHTIFLAHDLLEGRDTGSKGYDIAAQYVASAFLQYGLEPAGTEGYFQPVPLRRRTLVDNNISLRIGT